MQIYEVFISAETKPQAHKILDSLLAKKLATGGQFLESPAKFLWKGEVAEMNYITITSFTTDSKRQALIEDIEAISEEEIPMIRFVAIETNEKLMNWVQQTLE
ncbi:MAG TPA: divalent cation tolerance protein CutA [Candidatus Saccharimonadales bacterium]|nr:divalent cation tolerance protein CutA [Candidatus Saccharimonadales bacterium]